MAGVFLSYSRADRALAEQIIRGLRRLGVEVWWDQDMPGVDWQEELARELDAMVAVAVIWTPNALTSKYVRDEARLGLHLDKLVNVMAGAPSPPFPFDRVNGLSIDGWDGVSPHSGWTRLVQTIETLAIAAGSAQPGEITTNLKRSEQDVRAKRAAVDQAERDFHDAQSLEAEASEADQIAYQARRRAEEDVGHVRMTPVGPAILKAAQQEFNSAEAVSNETARALRAARTTLSAASRTLARAKADWDALVSGAPSPPEPVAVGLPPEPDEPPAPESPAFSQTLSPPKTVGAVEHARSGAEAHPRPAESPAGPEPAAAETVRPLTQGRPIPARAVFAATGALVLIAFGTGLAFHRFGFSNPPAQAAPVANSGKIPSAASVPTVALQIVLKDQFKVAWVVFSPDGRRIVSGSRGNTLSIWDASTGQAIGPPLDGDPEDEKSVGFSPDGRRIVSESDYGALSIWDASTDNEIGELDTGHTENVNSVAFSPDGRRVVSGSDDKTVRIWDAATGQEIGARLTGHTASVNSVAFSPDGRRIVSGSDDKTVRIWDASTRKEIGAPLTGHTEDVNSVAFSPDGLRVVSGSDDKTVRIWDAATGQEIGAPLTGHTEDVNSVAFSPDGRRIVSGSDDKTVRIWDASTGQAIGAPLAGHTENVNSVAFSPDGQRIVSGSDDKTMRIWRLSGDPLKRG